MSTTQHDTEHDTRRDLVALPGPEGLAELVRVAVNAADQEVAGRPMEPFPPLTDLAADDEDRRTVEAAGRHLHALLTTGALADAENGSGAVGA